MVMPRYSLKFIWYCECGDGECVDENVGGKNDDCVVVL